jgi:8-oxo-dGTP diphosphatase
MKERHKAVPAVYLVLIQEGKVLLMHRQNTGYCDGLFALPAGHVEAGELPRAALVREGKEELGIDIVESNLRLIFTMYRGKRDESGDRVDLFFRTDSWNGEIANMEPHKCALLSWFELDALPENLMPHNQDVLAALSGSETYSELRGSIS